VGAGPAAEIDEKKAAVDDLEVGVQWTNLGIIQPQVGARVTADHRKGLVEDLLHGSGPCGQVQA
jgi:hypothetical protein